MRWVLALLSVIGVSCAGKTVATTAETTTTGAERTTISVLPTTPTAPDDTVPTTEAPLGPPAPDFSLVLAGGETFELGKQTKPTYLVFWAEW